MTILANLITHDLIESRVLLRRYLKSSSLPIKEKMKHRPKPCHYRRDRVLRRLMQLSLSTTLEKISGGTQWMISASINQPLGNSQS